MDTLRTEYSSVVAARSSRREPSHRGLFKQTPQCEAKWSDESAVRGRALVLFTLRRNLRSACERTMNKRLRLSLGVLLSAALSIAVHTLLLLQSGDAEICKYMFFRLFFATMVSTFSQFLLQLVPHGSTFQTIFSCRKSETLGFSKLT